MMTIYEKYRYLIVPFIVWIAIQLFKVVYDRVTIKKWHWKRFYGAGGMPSAHSATVMTVTVLIAKYNGIDSPIFALSIIFAFIVMYDAAGVRRAVGKQAKVLNDILMDHNMTGAQKLQEMTGHTPIQVMAGAVIGIIAGLLG